MLCPTWIITAKVWNGGRVRKGKKPMDRKYTYGYLGISWFSGFV